MIIDSLVSFGGSRRRPVNACVGCAGQSASAQLRLGTVVPLVSCPETLFPETLIFSHNLELPLLLMPVLSAITCKTRGRVTWAASAARPPVSRRPFAQRRRSKVEIAHAIAIVHEAFCKVVPEVLWRPLGTFHHVRVQAKALDSSQTIAITQQLTSWAILVAGEGGWAWQRLKPDTPGRPSLPITGVIAGATIMVRHRGFRYVNVLELVVVLQLVFAHSACVRGTTSVSDLSRYIKNENRNAATDYAFQNFSFISACVK